jgi:hypothetical protein
MATLKSGQHLANLGVAGRIIQKFVLTKIGCDIVDCIHLSQDGDQWRALEKMVVDNEVS